MRSIKSLVIPDCFCFKDTQLILLFQENQLDEGNKLLELLQWSHSFAELMLLRFERKCSIHHQCLEGKKLPLPGRTLISSELVHIVSDCCHSIRNSVVYFNHLNLSYWVTMRAWSDQACRSWFAGLAPFAQGPGMSIKQLCQSGWKQNLAILSYN